MKQSTLEERRIRNLEIQRAGKAVIMARGLKKKRPEMTEGHLVKWFIGLSKANRSALKKAWDEYQHRNHE